MAKTLNAPYAVTVAGFVDIQGLANKLIELDDGDLVEIVKEGWARANQLENSRSNSVSGAWGILTAGETCNRGIAAMKILDYRHGEDYSLNLLGFRKPRGFIENVVYFFRGKLPQINLDLQSA